MTVSRQRHPARSVTRLVLSVAIAVPAHATLFWITLAFLMDRLSAQLREYGEPLFLIMVGSLSLSFAYGIGYLFRLAIPGKARLAATATACLLPLGCGAFVLFLFWSAPATTPPPPDTYEVPVDPLIPALILYFAATASGLLLATWRSQHPTPPVASPGDRP
ncbi:hypothetical protein [Niveispirillum sp. KHB5.9]|uniref:hypothetical protein n=1 Tax=Niveispirillum sp. KHB5.9 TaxID=3400269 RepID=UPI003A872AC5